MALPATLDVPEECTQCGDKSDTLSCFVYQQDDHGNGRDKPPVESMAMEEWMCPACTALMRKESKEAKRQVAPLSRTPK